jgi:hypothetical protein
MKHPGWIFPEVMSMLMTKAATLKYPMERPIIPEHFRGKIAFDAKLCIGCKKRLRSNRLTRRKSLRRLFTLIVASFAPSAWIPAPVRRWPQLKHLSSPLINVKRSRTTRDESSG